jgi:HK97 family phage portal protein
LRYLSTYGAATPADALELASTPWLDGSEVMPVAQGKAVQSAQPSSWSTDEWLQRLSADGVGIPGLSQAEATLRVGTVFACIRVIAEDTAKLPRHVFRYIKRTDGRMSTTKAVDSTLYNLLTVAPNDWMTGQELIEYMVAQAALRGQAFARLTRANDDPKGPILEILPLLPNTCRREQTEDWGVSYVITGYGAGEERVGPEFIWTLNGPMASPLAGADIRSLAHSAVDLAAKLEAAQTRFHAGDARPSGILVSKGALQATQKEEIRRAWQAAYGPGGSGGTAVLDLDFDFKSISTTAADSQVIENREFQIEEICRFFRVHPWAIMRQSSSQSYASIEQTGLAHIQHTIMTWVTRLEQTAQRDIIGRDSDLFLKINVNALARGTLLDRVNAYKTSVTVHMTPNEVRELEDMDPIDDPAMDRVQLPMNNTGLAPAPLASKPTDKPASPKPRDGAAADV